MRDGDRVSLQATVFNSTETTVDVVIGGRIFTLTREQFRIATYPDKSDCSEGNCEGDKYVCQTD